jgi:hypothetical protein
MSDRIVYLNLAQRKPAVVATAAPAIVVGRRYQLHPDDDVEELHGICGGQDFYTDHGRILPVSENTGTNHCYLWDVDEELISEELQLSAAGEEAVTLAATNNIITSQFVLSHGTLSEPHIIDQESTPQLTTTASFDFVFSTQLPQVRLGVLSLVETQRFALLKNGERYSLLDSGEEQALLYLTDANASKEVLTPILDTGAAEDAVRHNHTITLTQQIPPQLASSEIETLTVLEQYTSFFMQRELPFSQDNIWTPVSAPIAWGWSMRVTQRHDGDWCIVRQKLLMPTVGHNGLEMPAWEGNQLAR